MMLTSRVSLVHTLPYVVHSSANTKAESLTGIGPSVDRFVPALHFQGAVTLPQVSPQQYRKRVLVTGGTGYVGSVFVNRYALKHPNDLVVVVDNGSANPDQDLQFPNNVLVIQADFGTMSRMKQIFKAYQVDQVVHFAASAKVGESVENASKYWENTARLTAS